jgi:hypothetical protein
MTALLLVLGPPLRIPIVLHGLPYVPLALFDLLLRSRFFPEAMWVVDIEKKYLGLRGPLAMAEVWTREVPETVLPSPPEPPRFHKVWVFMPPILIFAELLFIAQGAKRFHKVAAPFAVAQGDPEQGRYRSTLPNGWAHGLLATVQQTSTGDGKSVRVLTHHLLGHRHGMAQIVEVTRDVDGAGKKGRAWRDGQVLVKGRFFWGGPSGTFHFKDPEGKFDERIAGGRKAQPIRGKSRIQCPDALSPWGSVDGYSFCADSSGKMPPQMHKGLFWRIEPDGTLKGLSVPTPNGRVVFEYYWEGTLETIREYCPFKRCHQAYQFHYIPPVELRTNKKPGIRVKRFRPYPATPEKYGEGEGAETVWNNAGELVMEQWRRHGNTFGLTISYGKNGAIREISEHCDGKFVSPKWRMGGESVLEVAVDERGSSGASTMLALKEIPKDPRFWPVRFGRWMGKSSIQDGDLCGMPLADLPVDCPEEGKCFLVPPRPPEDPQAEVRALLKKHNAPLFTRWAGTTDRF